MHNRRLALFLVLVIAVSDCAAGTPSKIDLERMRLETVLQDRALQARMYALAKERYADAPLFRASGAMPKNSHRPESKIRTAPLYPKEMAKAGIQDVVWVAFIINAQGSTERVEVISETAPSFMLAAKAAVEQWKFSPAVVDGKPVATLACQAISFTLN